MMYKIHCALLNRLQSSLPCSYKFRNCKAKTSNIFNYYHLLGYTHHCGKKLFDNYG